jgi:hypothetical protein
MQALLVRTSADVLLVAESYRGHNNQDAHPMFADFDAK